MVKIRGPGRHWETLGNVWRCSGCHHWRGGSYWHLAARPKVPKPLQHTGPQGPHGLSAVGLEWEARRGYRASSLKHRMEWALERGQLRGEPAAPSLP